MSPGGSPASAEGFARALAPPDLTFPADHGPHPAFRTEWWYLTGHLENGAEGGRRFGYQLTFFRSALRPPVPADGPGTAPTADTDVGDGSAWRSDQVFMAHFALTDVDAGRFHAFERFSRAALDLAGARGGGPLRVWLEDWELRSAGAGDLFPLSLVALEDAAGIELTLEAGRPPTLQGDAGLSRKGPEPGNASFYYSLTRLPTRGTVTVDGRAVEVEGSSWMDREWSTSALSEDVVGWDWFALELSDGRDLMLYRLRRADGSVTPESDGALLGRHETDPAAPGLTHDSERLRLGPDDATITPTGTWTSPVTGAVYPSGWRIEVPAARLELLVRPLLEAQEHTGSIAYWEGAVEVEGSGGGGPLRGLGYVELTGYAR